MGMMIFGPFMYLVVWVISAIMCLLTGHFVDLLLLTPGLIYPAVFGWAFGDLYGGNNDSKADALAIAVQFINPAAPIACSLILHQIDTPRLWCSLLTILSGVLIMGIEIGCIYLGDWYRGKSA